MKMKTEKKLQYQKTKKTLQHHKILKIKKNFYNENKFSKPINKVPGNFKNFKPKIQQTKLSDYERRKLEQKQ